MKRIAWGGAFLLVFCVLCVTLMGGADAPDTGPTDDDAKAVVPSEDETAPTEAPAFVSANWNIDEGREEELSAFEPGFGLPSDEPPAWAKRLKGTGVVHFDGKEQKGE